MIEQFVIGQAGAPFGLEGFVKVRIFSGETEHLMGLKEAVLRHRGSEKPYSIEKVRPAGDESGSLYLKFSGIDSPEAAKALNGAELLADRAGAAPLKDGEFYVEDLKGLELVAEMPPTAEPPSEILGHITGIVEGGGGDLAEIRLLSGETKLVPFRSEFIGEIDLAKGRAVLLKRWVLE